MTVTESLLRISELTKQNLQILQLINDSFYTKSNHLSTVVGETTYTIPSYIALENKVNHVQDAMNNLIHAAKSGEAWFNFDGNSKEILVRGYQQAPSPVNLPIRNKFMAETKTLFKDMLTPQPYLNFDMSELPDDIHTVLVKKIVPYNLTLQQALIQTCNITDESTNASAQLSWSDLVRIMGSGTVTYQKGTDYLEYDTLYELPVRNCTRSGEYVVEEVISDNITENLENVVRVRIHEDSPLICTNFDGTGTAPLSAGDELITYDGSAKLKIQKINPTDRTLDLLVLSGEYVNLIGAGQQIVEVSDYSILKLYSSPETARSLHIPLEEDKYVYITVAPLNPRLNIQSTWGDGLMFNTDNLRIDNNVGSGTTGFRTYYNNNVNNIGDAMIELASITYPSITKFSGADMKSMCEAPTFDVSTLQVVQINRHLNDSDAVKNIRALYSQKKQYQTDLNDIQSRIESLNDMLASISFDDMSGTRSAYTSQIADLKSQQNDLVTSLNKITSSIANAANNAEIPIEAAKFRIRGYVDVENFAEQVQSMLGESSSLGDVRDNILGVEVRYRYRNPSNPQANVSVIGENFLFTEWATYNPPLRERNMEYKDGQYVTTRPDITDSGFNYSDNVPKFNQVDIPISQGEVVEVQVRVLWGFGHPFVTVATDWSDAITVEFPPELVKDVQVTTIIEENNSDIETNRFETILQTKGIVSHVDDSIDDQDIKYFHKPESISSGFYTEERRIIPLSTKLVELNNDVANLKDNYDGSFAQQLQVSFTVNGIANPINEGVNNVIQLPAWSSIEESNDDKIMTGSLYKIGGTVYAEGLITLTNTTKHSLNIFSVFPGPRTSFISELKHKVFDTNNYFVKNPAKTYSDLGRLWSTDAADYVGSAASRESYVDMVNRLGGSATVNDTFKQNADGTYVAKETNNSTVQNLLSGHTVIVNNEAVELSSRYVPSGALATRTELTPMIYDHSAALRTPVGSVATFALDDEPTTHATTTADTTTADTYRGPSIVWLSSQVGGTVKACAFSQRANQIITYRLTNPYDGAELGTLGTNGANLYDSMMEYNTSHDDQGRRKQPQLAGLHVYPASSAEFGMCIDSDSINSKYSMAPGASVSFPVLIEYNVPDGTNNTKSAFSLTIGFDVRNSLYADPLYYQIQLVAKYNQTTQDRITNAKISSETSTKYNITVR